MHTSRFGRRLVGPLALAAMLLAPSAASTQAAASQCGFQLGFKLLHDALPGRVGSCLDDEFYNARGDSNQHTTGGLLVWRKADNWTAFTDGYQTWINGPFGIQQRLNVDRFSWEADGGSASSSSSTSVSSTVNCSAYASSGSVSATGLNSSTTIVSSDGGTTVITENSASSSSPGVATSGC